MTLPLIALSAGLMLAQADDAKKELDKIQGTWIAVTYDVNGMKPPADIVQTIKFVCTGDKYEQAMQGQVVEKGTHKLDPSKKPKHMDITVTEGEAKGQTQLAIYEFEGDTLKICANLPGSKERPTEFASKPGSSNVINIVLKREKKDK
jgi:uncharacterized protein (TIGR03067 family)